METLKNKVAESGIISLDLEAYYPAQEVIGFDMKDHLFMELILKEKDFREALKNMDWEMFRNKLVHIHCSADAVIPVWAFMLVSTYLSPLANSIYFGTRDEAIEKHLLNNIASIDVREYSDQRVVVKGCGEKEIPPSAYIAITALLKPVAKSIMYGEPCSTVPVYKKK